MTIVKRKISGVCKYVKYSLLQPGETVVIGEFKGTEMVCGYKSTVANSPQHTFIDGDGEEIKLNSAGQLNRILSSVPVGTLLEVIFLGKEQVSLNGRTVPVNQFEVSELYDDEAVA